MKVEKVSLSSERTDDIFMSSYQNQQVLDKAIDIWMSSNKSIQCRSDALSVMMELYDVQFTSDGSRYTDVIFIPK